MNHKNLKLFKILHDLSTAARDMTRVAKRTCQVRAHSAASLRSIQRQSPHSITIHNTAINGDGRCRTVIRY